ncbi:Contactin-associated protein-like 2 [Microtus ochrogaster]|uniref:Contactin-associated protein-like 2 n=1 Tax=Microtus ochrogaster TaxID=79684 RepID=A0A8J6FZY7_MICOH|nr:Contactin-associated protein-like 2 [Microtus ochrogaster]
MICGQCWQGGGEQDPVCSILLRGIVLLECYAAFETATTATEVSFSFDVGNGPVEIVVRSPSPLNDDQWHRVTAERNVKQASLQVDRLPQQIRKAPTEGHTRLELYSQLFVGGAGGQQGFLGCIRSLRMNGVTLDLEERAKVTSGFKSGCSGHCTSYGANCENGGKCIEKYHGYSCDCSNTAYDGTFCNKDVGAFFEEGMWLRYNFQAPVVTARDSGSKAENSAEQQPSSPDLAQEQIHFSFSTTKAPCILLYISSLTTDFLAVLVKPTGNLQIRYNLGGTKEPYNIDVDHRSIANGQPHSVNITRHEKTIILKIRYNLGGTKEPYNIDVDHRSIANGQPHSVNITRHEKTIILKERLLLSDILASLNRAYLPFDQSLSHNLTLPEGRWKKSQKVIKEEKTGFLLTEKAQCKDRNIPSSSPSCLFFLTLDIELVCRDQLTVGSAIPELMVLVLTRKEEEQATRSKSLSNTPPGLCSSSCFQVPAGFHGNAALGESGSGDRANLLPYDPVLV